jgi:hypothetical protein
MGSTDSLKRKRVNRGTCLRQKQRTPQLPTLEKQTLSEGHWR